MIAALYDAVIMQVVVFDEADGCIWHLSSVPKKQASCYPAPALLYTRDPWALDRRMQLSSSTSHA